MIHTIHTSKISYRIEGNELILANGNTVNFDYPIKKVLEASGIFVVMMRIPAGVVFNENVYGVGCDGKILWQIAPQKHLDLISSYTYMSCTTDGNVGLYNWDAGFYIIEPLTGKIIAEKFAK